MSPPYAFTPAGPPARVERDDGLDLWRLEDADGNTLDVHAATADDALAVLGDLLAAAIPPPDPAPALEHRLAEQLERLDPATADAAAIVGAVLTALRPVDSATVTPATTSKAP